MQINTNIKRCVWYAIRPWFVSMRLKFSDDALIRQSDIAFKYVVYLKPSFNTLCLRFFLYKKHSPRMCQSPMKNKWSPQYGRCWSSSKGVLCCCRPTMIKEVIYMFKYKTHYPISMIFAWKRNAYNTSIKCSNGLKTSDKEQSEKSNHWETTNTWGWRLYIEETLKKQDMNQYKFFVYFLV